MLTHQCPTTSALSPGRSALHELVAAPNSFRTFSGWELSLCAYRSTVSSTLSLGRASLCAHAAVLPYLCTFSGGGSPMCGCCSTLLVLHYLWAGEPHMHTQFMGVCSSTLLNLRDQPPGEGVSCVRCSALLFLLEGTHYSSPAGWPEHQDRTPAHYQSAEEQTMALTGASGPVEFSHLLYVVSLSHLLCRSYSVGSQLSLKGNFSKYRCTFYVFLGGGKLSILCCYLGPISLHKIFDFK